MGEGNEDFRNRKQQQGDAVPEAKIYRPAKTAMQSGLAGTRNWVLEFAPSAAQRRDALMGWAGGGDTLGQVRMNFPTAEEAVAFAEKHSLAYRVMAPRTRRVRPRSYADNFSPDRRGNWTH